MQKEAAKTIGVLGIQGSIIEHVTTLKNCGVFVREVLRMKDLEGLDGLVIPGGESTTLSKLLKKDGLDMAIRQAAEKGLPIYGTCAGMVLLSKTSDREMDPLALMDIEIERNAYGRQMDSFQTDVDIFKIANFPAVFIRAPKVKSLGEEVKVLAKHGKTPIMCRQENLLVTSFHPELTDDTRVHEYFISMC